MNNLSIEQTQSFFGLCEEVGAWMIVNPDQVDQRFVHMEYKRKSNKSLPAHMIAVKSWNTLSNDDQDALTPKQVCPIRKPSYLISIFF